jgi:Lon protease-like protein
MSTPADASQPLKADLGDIPLFPLPNVVLFPGAVLPLHIFEERYKSMTADALRGDRRIALALLRPGWEKSYYSRPAIDPVVCVGRILSAERLPDGKYNFLLQGEARALVVAERDDGSGDGAVRYRVAKLARLAESTADETDLADSRRRLQRLFARTALGATSVGRKFKEMAASSLPTPILADLIAATYLEDVALKQSLLAEQDIRCRVARVADELEATQPVCQSAYLGEFTDPTLN